eukprot:253237-Rhodomonas_salina.1
MVLLLSDNHHDTGEADETTTMKFRAVATTITKMTNTTIRHNPALLANIIISVRLQRIRLRCVMPGGYDCMV